jgi:hypothetical protein
MPVSQQVHKCYPSCANWGYAANKHCLNVIKYTSYLSQVSNCPVLIQNMAFSLLFDAAVARLLCHTHSCEQVHLLCPRHHGDGGVYALIHPLPSNTQLWNSWAPCAHLFTHQLDLGKAINPN